MYSEAIFMKVKGKKAAVYFSNRAFVHIKLENYAIAVMGKAVLHLFRCHQISLIRPKFCQSFVPERLCLHADERYEQLPERFHETMQACPFR